MNSYILPESFSEPTTIHRTQLFVHKKDGRVQLEIHTIESLV